MRSVTSPNHARQLHPLFHSFSILQSLQSGIKLQKVCGMQMRFRLLSKRYLPPAWFGKKGSRHSQQNVSNKFKDLAVVQIKSWNCGNGWHSYKRYQSRSGWNWRRWTPWVCLPIQDLWRPISQKHAVTVTLLRSKLWTKSLPKKVGFQGSNLESSWICRQGYEK